MSLFKNKMFSSTPSLIKEPASESFSGRGMKVFTVWFIVGIIGFFLLQLNAGWTLFSSPAHILEPLLYIVLLLGIWANRKYNFRKLFSLSRPKAALLFIGLSILTAMIYETTIAFAPEGARWAHYQEILPFYIPYAIIGYFLIRKFCFTFQDVFFVSGAASFPESLMAGYLFPPSPFSPFLLAYYFLVYSLYLCIPLIFIDEKLLWRKDGSYPKVPMVLKIVMGILASTASWLLPGLLGL